MSSWISNFLGVDVIRNDVQRVRHPHLELAVHTTFKTVQLCAVTGTGIVGPLLATLTPGCRVPHVVRTAARCGKAGALVGLASGPLLCYARNRNLSKDDVIDKCFRLRHDAAELRVDRATVGGLALGSLWGYGGVAACGVFTMVTGILGAEGYNWWREYRETEPLWFHEHNRLCDKTL